MNHSNTVQREFAKQALGFANPCLTLARADYLQWMLSHLPLDERARVLDVAAGTGHLSRAMASRVDRVVAVDLTIEMLLELAKQAAASNISNLAVVRALAEQIPLRDETFEVVVSRLAFHHLKRPSAVFNEMVRVCKRGGTVGIIDLVSPDDPTLAQMYNYNEAKRDPSHWRALTEAEIGILFQDAGLVGCLCDGRDIEVSVDAWLELARTPSADAQQIVSDLVGELDGGPRTGMRPFRHDQQLMFLQRWLVFVARKAA